MDQSRRFLSLVDFILSVALAGVAGPSGSRLRSTANSATCLLTSVFFSPSRPCSGFVPEALALAGDMGAAARGQGARVANQA